MRTKFDIYDFFKDQTIHTNIDFNVNELWKIAMKFHPDKCNVLSVTRNKKSGQI